MAADLQIRVLLNAIDRATAPLRRITSGGTEVARALKAARDQVKALNAQQADISAYRKQQQAMAGSSAQLQQAQERLRQLRAQMRATGGAAGTVLREDFRRANLAVRDLTVRLQDQRRQLAPHAARLREAGMSTGQLGEHEARLRQQVQAANQALQVQQQRMAELTRKQNALARAAAAHAGQQRMAGQLAGGGAAAMAGATPALYGGVKMLAPGLEFDASMSKVQAITRLDAEAPELKALREQARQLGGSTQFTAGQAANAQGFLGMAGFDPKAIKAAMPGMLDLAAAGGSDLAETADIASNVLSGLGLDADQMGRLGDVMVGTFTRSNTNLRMLGETMKYAAPMAKTYGISLETAAAMAGKLGDAGLQGSMGGTALSSIMNRLAAPPKAAAKALATLNIQTADANGNLRDLPDILAEIHRKTADMGTAVRGGLLKAIAGEEAVKGMAHLVDQAGRGELQALIATLRQANGEAGKTAHVMANNLKGDLTALGSAWQDLGIELEGQQDKPLRELAQAVTELIRGIKAWASENPRLVAGIVKTVAVVAALTFALGAAALSLATVMAPMILLRLMLARIGIHLPGLISLLWSLGKTVLPFVGKALLLVGRALMLNPIGAVLTLLAGAAYLVYRNWDTVAVFFTSAWEGIKQAFAGGIGGITSTIANFSPLGLLYQAFAGVMGYLGVDLPKHFSDAGGMMLDGLLAGLSSRMGALKGAISGMGDATIGWFKDKLGIHSPSRVFAELGGFTLQGLTQGLQREQGGPLAVITQLTRHMADAGALQGSAVKIDNRRPIAAASAPSVASNHRYEINIHPAQGMDPQAIARAVRAELARIDGEKQARQRSRLSDRE